MTQEHLKRTLLPLGSLTKDRVREIAREKDLPVADKPVSQEICFIPDNNYGRFLQEYLPGQAKPGPFLNKKGQVVGEHRGIIFYTVGQRKGIGIASREPLYVIAIDRGNNSIIIGKKEEVFQDELTANKVNFIDGGKLEGPLKVEAKVRYRQQASPATVTPLGRGEFKVRFAQPQWAITPGQAVVFYLPPDGCSGKNGTVVGGGTIISQGR